MRQVQVAGEPPEPHGAAPAFGKLRQLGGDGQERAMAQEIRAWIKKKYGFNVNSASISQTKRKYGLIADSGDTERRYIQKVKPEKEAAIREALVWFGIIKGK